MADKKSTRIERLLTALTTPGGPRSRGGLREHLGVSFRALDRDLKELREDRGIPIRFDPDSGLYVVDGDIARQHLRGLYFEPAELDALLIVYHMLQTMEGGLLREKLAPLHDLVTKRLSRYGDEIASIAERIRIVSSRRRSVPSDTFTECARATLKRKRIHINYQPRGSGKPPGYRIVSPQHLFRYRDNWYLVAHCHKKKEVRHFSLEQILYLKVIDEIAEDVKASDLDPLLTSGYGIFSGTATQTAIIRFTPFRSTWVHQEVWHPKQSGRFLEDGSWELSLPYNSDTELIADIMEYGAEAEVVGPLELREKIRSTLAASLARYS